MSRQAQDPYLGTVVAARYRVQDTLGTGSMGTVYAAWDEREKRPVALKMIHQHLAMHTKIAERFRREMAITAGLDSPYTVRVHEFGTTPGGELYLAMELLKGRTLHDELENGPLDAARVVRIARRICRALDSAHKLSIIHRDLKPENIMLIDGEREDEVRILDFGIARIIDSEDNPGLWETLTRAGTPLGTLPYMSPEQVACEPLGPLTDLYSLGIVMYEMLAGMPPFQPRTRKEALRAHLEQDPPPLADSTTGGLYGALWTLISDLLQKEIEDRPQSAREVTTRLEEMAELYPLEDQITGAFPPLAGGPGWEPASVELALRQQQPRNLAQLLQDAGSSSVPSTGDPTAKPPRNKASLSPEDAPTELDEEDLEVLDEEPARAAAPAASGRRPPVAVVLVVAALALAGLAALLLR